VLDHMLRHAGHQVDVLYYEVLDIPLPQLEQLKTLRVGRRGTVGCIGRGRGPEPTRGRGPGVDS